MVAGAGEIKDRVGDGGLAGGVSEGTGASFEDSDPLFEYIGGGITDAGIDVAQLF